MPGKRKCLFQRGSLLESEICWFHLQLHHSFGHENERSKAISSQLLFASLAFSSCWYVISDITHSTWTLSQVMGTRNWCLCSTFNNWNICVSGAFLSLYRTPYYYYSFIMSHSFSNFTFLPFIYWRIIWMSFYFIIKEKYYKAVILWDVINRLIRSHDELM